MLSEFDDRFSTVQEPESELGRKVFLTKVWRDFRNPGGGWGEGLRRFRGDTRVFRLVGLQFGWGGGGWWELEGK